MKKIKSVKRLIALILVFAMCFLLVPNIVMAENANEVPPTPVIAQTTATTPLSYAEIEGATLPNGVEALAACTLDESTNKSYPWSIYNGDSSVFCSGNKGKSNSVSVMKVTVKGSGALVYQYKVFSTDMDAETQPDSLLVSVGLEINKSTGYTTAENSGAERFYSSQTAQDYTRKVIKITAGDDETTDIYFTYKKNGSIDGAVDMALVTGIEFNTGTSKVTVSASDSSLGTVTGSGTYYAGDDVTVTATPVDGAKVYGWSVDGKLVDGETSDSYTFTSGADVNVKALLGTSATAAQNRTTGEIYTDVSKALADAESGDTVELVNNAELTTDAEIKTGITLYIPYDGSHDADGNTDGTTADSSSAFATEAKTYKKLTVKEGATLTVNGELLIGGTISYPSQMYSGHTSGVHGRITNNGTIAVKGGQIDCYGFIDGSGSVIADTGTVYEPFVVYDFSGGNNTLALYNANQNPFTQYTMQNISCVLTIKDTAAYGVYCNLYASSAYNKTNALLIGGTATAPNAMILLSENAELTRTVDKTKSVSGGTVIGGTYGADIYKTLYNIKGGASLNNMAMKIYGVDVSVKQYPIPYSFSYVLTDGDYTMPNGWILLPGAEMTVAEGATLTSNGKLFVLDGLINSGMSGKYYPSSAKLAASGFATCGVLIVNGTLNLKTGSSFGGTVQTDGSGKIVVEQSVTLANTVQTGATAYYDDNTCISELNAKAYIKGTQTVLTCGTTYTAVNGNSRINESYTVTSYAKSLQSTVPTSGTYKQTGDKAHYAVYAGPETVTVNQAMKGEFRIAETVDGVTVLNKTYYDVNDTGRTEVVNPVVSGSTVTFTVARTETGAGYNYAVQATINDGTPQTVTPDANGVYTVNGVNGPLTITVISVLRGDANLDGAVAANDVTVIRRVLGGYTSFKGDFNKLAADCNKDGTVAANDVTKLRRYLGGYTTQL